MLFSVSPGHVVFSGFASSVVWLVFGGLVLGVAIKRTGLKPKAVIHFLILVTLVSILFLLPINFLWWHLVGWI